MPRVVKDEVVPRPAPGEVLLGVVNDMVSADGPDKVHIPGAAHPGHFRAECLGYLHGEGANTSRRASDQHLLPRLDPPVIAKTLQGGDTLWTCPATARPRTPFLGANNPSAMRMMYGSPRR